jgi:hypothetical protein
VTQAARQARVQANPRPLLAGHAIWLLAVGCSGSQGTSADAIEAPQAASPRADAVEAAPAPEITPPSAPASGAASAAQPAGHPAPGGDPLRRCVQSPNYSRCVIDAFDYGRTARTCDELKVVLEAYRALGNDAAALRMMRTFVDRCDSDRGVPIDRPRPTRRG